MGSPCSTNATTWTVSSNVGDIIIPTGYNELVTAINKECIRRGVAQISNSATYRDIITSVYWQTLSDKVNAFGGYGAPTFTQYNTISSSTTGSLKTSINTAEQACPCNCDYACTCNCNYACTCNCNYCTCNCNYACTCNCNYACTCNCNYCTCNCNYCTCNCNYACTCNCNYACTCNCNYCTCNCNYCTCNCNYCTCNCNKAFVCAKEGGG